MAEFDPVADLRQFMHELTLRFERSQRSLERVLVSFERSFSGLDASMAALVAEMRIDRAEIRADLRDLREESRAQTQALLRMIDRLDNGGAAPAG